MAKQRASMPKEAPRARRKQPAASPTRRILPWVGLGALLIAVVVGIFLLVQSNTANAGVPGVRFTSQGQEHIAVGASHPPYNSDPPTSGWHYAEPVPTGFYETPKADEALIHNLEHGHVVISYDCSKLADCEATKQQLRRIYDSYSAWKVTVAPRENRDAAIALTAWQWLDQMDSFDEARIRRFIDAWRNRGPEQTME